jgi:hypothetical protein
MDHQSLGRYTTPHSYENGRVNAATAFGRTHQQFSDVRPHRFAVESPQRRAQHITHQQHRLMWTPELAIQEIVDGSSALPPLQLSSTSRPVFQGRQQQQQLDIKSFQNTSTSTPTTQATAALEFETTSAATNTIDRSLANDRSFGNQQSDTKWSSPYVVERTPLRSALAKKKAQPNSQPSSYRSRSARGLSEERASQSHHESLLASPQNESLQAVSPINIDLSQHHNQLQPFSTPNPKYLPNDTTLSASGVRSDHHSPHSTSRLTPSMEVKIIRKEMSDLRMLLAQEQQRSQALEEDLVFAKGELNNTSVHVDVRERECMELNDFVDTLQKRCRYLEIELSELRTKQEMERRVGRLEQATSTIAAASPKKTDTEFEATSNIIISSLELENRELASRLAQSTLEIAQMKAILDRLELHAPYPPEMVGTAKKQLRHFVELQ